MNAGQYEGLAALLTEIRDRLPTPERTAAPSPVAAKSAAPASVAAATEAVRIARSYLAKQDLVQKLSALPFVKEIAGQKLATPGAIARILVVQLRAAGIVDYAESPPVKPTPTATDALLAVLEAVDGWVEGTKSNHVALEHGGESMGSECWTQFHPDDIRRMVNDAARDVGLPELWDKNAVDQ